MLEASGPTPASTPPACFEDAIGAHQTGDIVRAELLYREILTVEPRHADALHLLGLVQLQRGRADAAADSIQQSLDSVPNQPAAYLNLGVALRNLKRPQEALASFQRALALAPDYAEARNNIGDVLLELNRPAEALASLESALAQQPQFSLAWNNRGNALRSLQRYAEALASYEQALRLQPDLVRAWNNRGHALRHLSRLPEALGSFERALQIDPEYAPAIFNRGSLLLELKRYPEALECYERLLQRAPDDPEALTSRSMALIGMKRPEAALTSLQRALALRPDDSVAHNALGNALRELKRPEDALVSYTLALRQSPQDADVLNNRGNALSDLRRYQDALQCYDAALQQVHKPDFYHNRGNALHSLHRPAEALADYEQALQLDPGYRDALFGAGTSALGLKHYEAAARYFTRLQTLEPDYAFAAGMLLHLHRLTCDWATARVARQSVIEKLGCGLAADLPFSFLAVTDDPALQRRCATLYADERYRPPAPLTAGQSRRCGPYRHQRIRVAYVSADLRNHVVARLLAGVWEQHDRRRFEVIGISLAAEDQTPFGQRVKLAFDRFIDVSAMDDAAVARLLRELEIDIAVDLNGYTDGHRTGLFALRAAPVQVNYLGFPGTMGADYIDYILADRFVLPEEHSVHYTEQVAYLPACFQANDTRRAAPESPTRAELGLPESAFVWCCLNSAFKLAEPTFNVWMRLLQAIPHSVLWLLGESVAMEKRLKIEAAARNVDPSRLLFAARVGYEEHIARLSRADLFLDTLPFNAGATASDSLWAGLPVLTCIGRSFASRMAGSVLRAAGLTELITDSLASYEQRALELARSPERLAALRSKLATQRANAPLFDTRRFVERLERAFECMWQRGEDGEAPRHFEV
jgi:predicted O-linked N-acetylglucosamine transferase (SPINDLY family)